VAGKRKSPKQMDDLKFDLSYLIGMLVLLAAGIFFAVKLF